MSELIDKITAVERFDPVETGDMERFDDGCYVRGDDFNKTARALKIAVEALESIDSGVDCGCGPRENCTTCSAQKALESIAKEFGV